MATWPATLPQRFEQSGYNQTAADNTVRTAVDQGPAFQRPKYSTSPTPIAGTMTITKDQLRTFLAFYANTLAFGAVPFNWIDPIFEEPAEVQFDTSKPYRIAPVSGAYYRITLAIEVNP